MQAAGRNPGSGAHRGRNSSAPRCTYNKRCAALRITAGEYRVAKGVQGIARCFLSAERAIAFFQFARRHRQAGLECRAEALQNAKPVTEAGSVTHVDDDKIEKIRIVVLVDVPAIPSFAEVPVVGDEYLANLVLALRAHIPVDLHAGGRRKCGKPEVNLVREVVAVYWGM